MKPRIYWAPPYVAALIMGALSFPGLASALTLEQALSVAEQDAPSLHAQAANLVAARSAAIPAGELPDPKLKLGLQSVPIEGDARWQLEQEAMPACISPLEIPDHDIPTQAAGTRLQSASDD